MDLFHHPDAAAARLAALAGTLAGAAQRPLQSGLDPALLARVLPLPADITAVTHADRVNPDAPTMTGPSSIPPGSGSSAGHAMAASQVQPSPPGPASAPAPGGLGAAGPRTPLVTALDAAALFAARRTALNALGELLDRVGEPGRMLRRVATDILRATGPTSPASGDPFDPLRLLALEALLRVCTAPGASPEEARLAAGAALRFTAVSLAQAERSLEPLSEPAPATEPAPDHAATRSSPTPADPPATPRARRPARTLAAVSCADPLVHEPFRPPGWFLGAEEPPSAGPRPP